jgi:alpha-amylase
MRALSLSLTHTHCLSINTGNHVAPVDLSFEKIIPFNQSAYYHSKCQIEDWNNQYQVENCRLANLPDLNQDNTYVRSTLLNWIGSLKSKYGFDGYRVDTIPEVHPDFWSEFNTAAGQYCVGEVFNGDINYVSNYQKSIDGVLSYPLYFTLTNVFAYQQSMNQLETLLGPSGSYWSKFKDVNLLGTFVDNHDNPRFLYYNGNWNLYKNALVLSLFTSGIPIVYYGAEQGYNGGADPANRESLWPNYNTNHDLYKFLASYVGVRKAQKVWTYSQVQRYSTNNFYAFSRGNVLVCLTNSGGSAVTYTLSYLPYTVGQVVCNSLNSNDCLTVTSSGITVTLEYGLPKVYIPK